MSRARPVGTSPGTAGLVLAWLGGVAVVRLTGATPVILVLAVGAVLGAWAVVSGWWLVRRHRVLAVRLPATTTVGAEVPVEVRCAPAGSTPLWLELEVGDERIAAGWSTGATTHLVARFARRGVVGEISVSARAAGAPGTVWWRTTTEVVVDDVVVAPVPKRGTVRVDRSLGGGDGERAGRAGAVSGDTDGVRPWREGDTDRSVHWASTFRAGELVVHDRRQAVDRSTTVRARTHTGDPDAEAAAARWALDESVRAGDRTYVVLDDGPMQPIDDHAAAEWWSATAELGPSAGEKAEASIVDVLRAARRRIEPEVKARVVARYWAGAATLVSLVMLTRALAYSTSVTAAVTLGVVAGTAVSARHIVTGDPPALWVRTLVGVGALIALAMVLAASGRVGGVFDVLRGPLPQLLLVLIVLHGFESRDRRTVRVGLGISAVVLMYASAFRVDDAIAWWLLAWAVCFWFAISGLAAPTQTERSRPRRPARTMVRSAGWAALAAGAAVTLLVVVPVPQGPARLTLPTLITDPRPVSSPGAIVGPEGEVRESTGASAEPTHAPAGQPGGYNGFANSMDTSVRGALGDEVVMRVHTPAPDFWRGQTFSTFDGRTWFADDEVGTVRDGPQIEIPRAFGDVGGRFLGDVGIEYEEFIQTFYVEADMPNVIFAAYRPDEVIVDASVWTRADGAIRASTVFVADSVYTVVSRRPMVDAEQLRLQGDVAERLTAEGIQAFDRYLTVPATTTQRTRDLAAELAAGHTSTYDVVVAYEEWISQHVQYDLSAPLPAPGQDAVDHFLFDSQLGFCEQIASALTIMLRTQGVPARLATGYAAGQRDRIAGVYEVRASDAHAWVEVWFPESGWQAFDPTASVPLSARSAVSSVGADLIGGIASYVGEHRGPIVMAVGLAVAGLAALIAVRELRRRRRRGRWGLLQDEFSRRAVRRGTRVGAANPELAETWTDVDDAAVAREVAERLDRVAFDPTWTESFTTDGHGEHGHPTGHDWYRSTAKLVGSLPGPRR